MRFSKRLLMSVVHDLRRSAFSNAGSARVDTALENAIAADIGNFRELLSVGKREG